MSPSKQRVLIKKGNSSINFASCIVDHIISYSLQASINHVPPLPASLNIIYNITPDRGEAAYQAYRLVVIINQLSLNCSFPLRPLQTQNITTNSIIFNKMPVPFPYAGYSEDIVRRVRVLFGGKFVVDAKKPKLLYVNTEPCMCTV
jgi:hypothetical protein